MIEWHVYIDGASSGNPGESGAGIFALNGSRMELFRESIYLGSMTNNMAEYEALIRALEKAAESHVNNLSVYTDSLLIANQVNGIYKVKNACLQGYAEKAKSIVSGFDAFTIKYIPREENAIADKLAKKGVKKG
jgi:ribonuclease HI